jgi:hypothetical protein
MLNYSQFIMLQVIIGSNKSVYFTYVYSASWAPFFSFHYFFEISCLTSVPIIFLSSKSKHTIPMHWQLNLIN